jgi:hypothetical protein
MRVSLTMGVVVLTTLAAVPGWAREGVGEIHQGVPAANKKSIGTSANIIGPEFATRVLAQGADPLENPSGVITKFGRLNDGGAPDKQGTLTEPDENTFLVLDHNPGGPSAGFDYGRHFLFQGHENGSPGAYITRINLDVSGPHRITLLTPGDSNGTTGFGSIDGSSFNPFTNTLLFTQERSRTVAPRRDSTGAGAVIQVSIDWPPQVNTLEAFLGLGGFEGIHPDDKGNIYIIEDIGGRRPGGIVNGVALNQAAQPNSFVYRYLPNDSHHIEAGGKLQALQVIIDGKPVVFGGAATDDQIRADILADAQLKLHRPGSSWPIRWVTIHESKAGDTNAFDANAAAKDAGATPFKRPENMAWLPGSDFRTFFFDPTGDTDAPTSQVPALAARGSWGSIFRVDLREEDEDRDEDHERRGKKAQDDGHLSVFVLGDQVHNSFDNLAMANEHTLLAAEDRGDTLHSQLDTLDSIWAFDVRKGSALRFLALGRDATSIANGEDNEPTGVFVSNGSRSAQHLLGTEENLANARGFFTQQHGNDIVFEFSRVFRDE